MEQGQLLGDRYLLGEELGRGGFGVVWEAYDQRVGRQVAVKALRYRGDRAALTDQARFWREMQVLARLPHPNVVLILDQGQAVDGPDSCDYLVMERLAGPTLKQVLEEGRTPLPRALDWARQLCAALAAAHAAEVVHRDIKPENVMFAAADRQLLKVLDFGIAQIGDNRDGLTTDGAVIGSAAYLAPERWHGEPGSARSDLYALGCVLWELFTGERPFTAEGTVGLMLGHVKQPLPHPGALPAELAELLAALLAKEPDDRPADAAEVGRRLERVAEGVRDLRRQADAAFEAGAVGALAPLVARFAQAYGPRDGRTLRACHDVAVLLERTGERDRAYGLLVELLPHAVDALGTDHPDVADLRRRLDRTPAPARPAGPGQLARLLAGVNRAGG
ncbi:protein kinase domain-containing protein [Kitasatospora sp. LaBMicrA B282]|uniref:serine/threonine-protein kinase n=1 Tax=Kitasatospora sp. LaBMicrA B282 TaxID=3420949 RepID=UPI003D0B38B8